MKATEEINKIQLIEYPHLQGIFIKYENGVLISSACDKNGKELYLCFPIGEEHKRCGVLDL